MHHIAKPPTIVEIHQKFNELYEQLYNEGYLTTASQLDAIHHDFAELTMPRIPQGTTLGNWRNDA